MVSLTWLRGLLGRRRGRLVGTALGVAVGVALLASIGSFLASTNSRMTRLAINRVPVDWQVEAQPGADARALVATTKHFPGVHTALPVGFARSSGFQAGGRSVQSTGPGRVLGLPPGYARAFPGAIRTLSGRGDGVVLFQQTAANLHARPGDKVMVGRAGMRPAGVRIDGVVDLPAIDSLFQQVGAPVGAQAQAPPDNVMLMPSSVFKRVEGPLAARRPDLVRTQAHVALDHRLPNSPSAAFDSVSGHARNLETRLTGAGLVGDNLGTTLDKARSDALYAQILFLFLGVPGAILAGLITAELAAAGAERRRRDQALLRTRGATAGQLTRTAVAEAVLAGGAGAAAGLGAALLIGKAEFGAASFGAGPVAAVTWAAGSALAGLAIAGAAIVLPARRQARELTVASARRTVGRDRDRPMWARLWLDVVALVAGGLVYWQASRNGYQLVLAPEGVPQVSVNWYALAGPVLAWVGGGLLVYRLSQWFLGNGRGAVTRLARPLGRELAPTVAATMARQRGLLARALTLVALTAAFAGSTAIFNSTFEQQAEADARLTNGADVTVTESPGAAVGPAAATRLQRVPGVKSVEPLQHRFAYVGADLQDLYGVRPETIGKAGKLQNAWFMGGSADQLMKRLRRHPDGVLVAAETVKDFQLQPGDPLRLRLVDATTGHFRTVQFHYIGVGKEFPTAPRDSFLVANASYVAKQTGSNAVGSFLLQTGGRSSTAVAGDVRRLVGTGVRVDDIASSRRVVGSNLTAVSLSGLTRVELAFALVLAAASTGLVLGLGLAERRTTFAIARALGARPRQLGAFAWTEAGFVAGGGLALGSLAAAGLALMLVKVLTGVFDPPPDSLAVPWGYLLLVAATALAAVAAATTLTLRALRRPSIETLRDL